MGKAEASGGTSTTMRRRREDDTKVELLDEVDQDKVVQEIRQENDQQQAQILSLFRILSIAAATISILCALLVQRRAAAKFSPQSSSTVTTLFRWVHAVLSAFLHYNCTTIIIGGTDLSWKIYKPAGITLLLASIALFVARRRQGTSADDDGTIYLHQGLVVSNAVTIAAAYWLRRDRILSEKAIKDLQSSKYRYKSL